VSVRTGVGSAPIREAIRPAPIHLGAQHGCAPSPQEIGVPRRAARRHGPYRRGRSSRRRERRRVIFNFPAVYKLSFQNLSFRSKTPGGAGIHTGTDHTDLLGYAIVWNAKCHRRSSRRSDDEEACAANMAAPFTAEDRYLSGLSPQRGRQWGPGAVTSECSV
jgi:hypothetical protein